MLWDIKAIAETEKALARLRSAAIAMDVAAENAPESADQLQAFAAEIRALHDRVGRQTGLRHGL